MTFYHQNNVLTACHRLKVRTPNPKLFFGGLCGILVIDTVLKTSSQENQIWFFLRIRW